MGIWRTHAHEPRAQPVGAPTVRQRPDTREHRSLTFTTMLTPTSEVGLLAAAEQALLFPAGMRLSAYWLQVSALDPATGQLLQAGNLKSSASNFTAGSPDCE